jgi:ABC-type multidrug transport system ATPase subunit
VEGTKKKLERAIALISRPSLVLFDEATTGLDPLSRRDLYRYLRSNKISALIITLNLDDVETYCDNVGILMEGTLQEFDSHRDLLENYSNIDLN